MTLKKKIGMVNLVGIAARLEISAIAIALIAMIQNIKALPDRATSNTVMGVSIQP